MENSGAGAETCKAAKALLQNRGKYFLWRASKVPSLSETIESHMQSNQSDPLYTELIWVEPYLWSNGLIPLIAQDETRQFCLSNPTASFQIILQQLMARYFSEFQMYDQYYQYFTQELLNSKDYAEQKRANEKELDRLRKDKMEADRRRRDEAEAKRKEEDTRRREDQARRREQDRLRKEEDARKKAELELKRKEEEEAKTPKTIAFKKRSVTQFVTMVEHISSEMISDRLKAQADQYKNRKKVYIILTERIFEQKYADKKMGKNLTISFSKGQKTSATMAQEDAQGITRASEGARPTVGAMVGGLMRSVQSVQTTMLKQRIRKENYAEKLQEQAATDEDHYRRDIKFQLNLLTPENFEQLTDNFLALAFKNELSCKILVEEISFKAWNQQKYCALYASLCKWLCQQTPRLQPGSFPETATKDTKDSKEAKEKNPFYYILIAKVEGFFSKADTKLDPSSPDYEQDFKYDKQRKLGNIKFISELIAQEVLFRNIIKIVFFQLMGKYLAGLSQPVAAEISLEGVITMFDKLGESIEKKQKAGVKVTDEEQKLVKEAQKFAKGEDPAKFLAYLKEIKETIKISLVTYFKIFEHFQKCDFISNRIKALFKNLATKKDNQWKEQFKTEGPKKLAEIHGDDYQDQSKQISFEQVTDRVLDILDKSGPKYAMKDLEKLMQVARPNMVIEQLLLNICDGSLPAIREHRDLVSRLVINGRLGSVFIESWNNKFKQLADLSSDQPYLSTFLASTLVTLFKEKMLAPEELRLPFLDEEEDEKYFYGLVLAKMAWQCPELGEQMDRMVVAAGCDLRVSDYESQAKRYPLD